MIRIIPLIILREWSVMPMIPRGGDLSVLLFQETIWVNHCHNLKPKILYHHNSSIQYTGHSWGSSDLCPLPPDWGEQLTDWTALTVCLDLCRFPEKNIEAHTEEVQPKSRLAFVEQGTWIPYPSNRCHTVYMVNVEMSIEDILCRDKAFSLGENVEPKFCDSLVGFQTDQKLS